MANLSAAENWTWTDGCDDLSNSEVSQIDGEIVMSLLNDMQDDQLSNDDERLTNVIRSLEAEIDQGQSHPTLNNVVSVNGHDYFQDEQERNYNDENLQSWDTISQYQSKDFVKPNDLDFSWMEMEMEMASSYPSDDMNLWYMNNNFGQDYQVIGGIFDYSDIISFEENDYHSLWQEQNV